MMIFIEQSHFGIHKHGNKKNKNIYWTCQFEAHSHSGNLIWVHESLDLCMSPKLNYCFLQSDWCKLIKKKVINVWSQYIFCFIFIPLR